MGREHALREDEDAMKPTKALLLELHEMHFALLMSSRNARWQQSGELLLNEEQVRADEELTLERGTTELAAFVPWVRLRRPSSCDLAQRCSSIRPENTETLFAVLVHGHRRAAQVAEHLLDAALEENELRLATVAAERVREHREAAKTLERIRCRVSSRSKMLTASPANAAMTGAMTATASMTARVA